MAVLLIVHHTTSPALQAMFEAARAGTSTDEIEGVEVAVRPALTASAADVLAADGYLLGTPANIGYMSGALKHFFDGIYYPCLEATQRRPYALYVHGAGGVDHLGIVLAAGPAAAVHHRPPVGRRPGELLGARRRPGRRTGWVLARAPGGARAPAGL